MALTSFSFLCFVVVTVLVYYILPGRIRWLSLLTASLLFCYLSGGFAVLGFLLYGILVTYLGALLLQRLRQESRFKGFATGGVVCLTLLPLFLLKYIRFFGFETPFGMLAPLGISFYTMTLLGYVIDVSWGTARAQKNPLKHALFACYFPQMVSGPITRYGQMESQLFVKHSFSYEQAAFGAQRILWGFFKKLVISERLAMVVDAVYGWYSADPGLYLVVANVCFAFQLYTDFSGCMDIVLGVSQILGITLPENFTCPYFSLSISEYWRRWHITLGAWFKDYVFYPLQKSSLWISFQDWSKKKLGKKRGKKLTLYLSMLVLWFSVGMWHGGSWNFIVGSGLLHWFYIVSGELLSPVFKKLTAWFRIQTDVFSWRLFQALRTFLLVNLGFVFFRARSLGEAFAILKAMCSRWNPEILFDRSFFKLLSPQDWVVVLTALLALLVVSALQQKMRVRSTLARQNLLFRWSLYLLLCGTVLVFGCYGGDYNAAAFIYQRF